MIAYQTNQFNNNVHTLMPLVTLNDKIYMFELQYFSGKSYLN